MHAPDWIVVATYNERQNLERLIPQLRESAPNACLIVVDDNSPDGSGDYAAGLGEQTPQVHCLKRKGKLGYGTAILDGFRYALEHGAERVVTLDADLSHDPAAVPDLLAALDDADVAIGSRYIGGIRILNWSLGRLALSLFANVYVRTILGLRVHDATSGFRGYRAQALRDLLDKPPSSTGYSFLVECLYLLLVAGHRIEEVPIIYHERRVGQSKMSSGVITEAVWRPIALRAKFLLRRR